MSFEQIIYEISDSIATVTLNRPDKLNAMTPQMGSELYAAMDQADKDEAVRVIILTGAGRGFCSGADMSRLSSITDQDFGSTPSDEMKEKIFKGNPREGVPEDFQKKYSYFPAVSKPIICAINGASVGVGFILPLYCDIRFASEEAKFGTAFSRRGLIAEHGVNWLLPRLVGISNALDLLYSARIFQAPEALQMGLVSRVLPADTLMEQARDYAGMLVNEVSPRSLREIKREVYNALFQTLGEAIDEANEDMVKSFACEDFKEGVAHFLEKRPPKFTGK